MRRIAPVAFAAVTVLIACSSGDDDGSATSADAGKPKTSTTVEADAATNPDAQVDPGTDAATDAAPVMEFSGQATYYNADGTGACGFKATPNNLLVAAMNGSQYKKSLCGQCVLVTGPKGMVKVRIVDLCPGCAMGGLDLSESAFAKISPLSAGRVKITWHFVTC